MIRLLIVDDHPAMRAGLTAVLRAEPGMVPLATRLARPRTSSPRCSARGPTSSLLDYHLPGTDGLRLCRRLKRAGAGAGGAPVLGLRRRLAGDPGGPGRRRRAAEQERAGARSCSTRCARSRAASACCRRCRASCWPPPPSSSSPSTCRCWR